METSPDIVANYLASTTDVRTAFAGMTREQLLARPIPGKWSAMEVLCHLVDTDLSTALRIRATLRIDNPSLPGVSKEEVTSHLSPDARDVAEELTLFHTVRAQTARIIRALPPETLSRSATITKANSEVVTRTVSQFLTGLTGHVAHHLRFVHEKRLALGLPANI